MATIKQIDANRRNAELSTGPVTPEGKQAVSLNAHKRFDLLQRRINSTERNFHRSLKALLALEPQPELASFPQEVLSEPPRPPSAVSAVKSEPDLRPEPEQSKPTSEKLASFPQTDFHREISATPRLRVESQPAVADDSPQNRDAA